MDECIFCKLINGEIPANKIYEDDSVMAFLDIAPVNKGHTLIIPKQHHEDIFDIPEELLTHISSTAKKLTPAIIKGVKAEGVNLTQNNKKAAGQVVFHYHLHIVPRFSDDGLELWPGNSYTDGEAEELAEKIKEEL